MGSSSSYHRPARIKRRHDLARTPFDRLCDTGILDLEGQAELEQLRSQTNPRQLRREIYDLIHYILDLPGAIPGQLEDIFQTLGLYTISERGGNGSSNIII